MLIEKIIFKYKSKIYMNNIVEKYTVKILYGTHVLQYGVLYLGVEIDFLRNQTLAAYIPGHLTIRQLRYMV